MNDNRPPPLTPAVSPEFNEAIDKALPGFTEILERKRALEEKRKANERRKREE